MENTGGECYNINKYIYVDITLSCKILYFK